MRPRQKRAPVVVAVLALLCPLALHAEARADDAADADASFKRGVADMEAGRYATGCEAIAQSLRLDPRPGTLFSLATCEDRWGHAASAFKHYGAYLAAFDQLSGDRKVKQGARPRVAKTRRAKLAPDVPELTVSLPPDAPAGTVVKRDGQVLAAAALGVGLPVDAGDHVLTTQAPGGPVLEQPITIGAGEKKRLTLEVKAAPEAGPTAPGPAPEGASGQRVAAYVVGGVGIAGLIVGGAMGGLALAKRSTVNQNCGAGIGSKDPTACNRTGLDAASSAQSAALGSTVGIVIGAAGVVTAVVLILTDRKATKPSSAARGPWISAGVLSLGPDGATVGARGAF